MPTGEMHPDHRAVGGADESSGLRFTKLIEQPGNGIGLVARVDRQVDQSVCA